MVEVAKNSTTQDSAEINKDAAKRIRNVTARVIEIANFMKDDQGNTVKIEKANGQVDSKATPGASQAEISDPFLQLLEQGRVIEPPFDLMTLAMLPEHSSELGQCIEAMEINISGTGHRYVKRMHKVVSDDETFEMGAEQKKASAQEKADLINFFDNCTDESFIAFRRKLTKDLETTGNAYCEVVRDSLGKISAFYHVPSYQMRLGTIDRDPVLTFRMALLVQADGSYKQKEIAEYRKFRVYCQSRSVPMRSFSITDKRSIKWFKEFGDKRKLNRNTGYFQGQENDKTIPKKLEANEMVHFTIYSARSAYGIPRYIGNLLSIFGDRAAEEINFMTFRNNNIPSMVVTVSNGQLTDGTIKRIESFVESQIQKSNNYSKFLLIEAEPFSEQEGEDGGQVKIDIKPLTSEQIGDALFQNYSTNNQDKIRRAFRLPSIMVGISADLNRAVAEVARRLADEQVFQPERGEFDSVINRKILPEMGILFHEFRSNTPNTTDNAQLVRILASSEKTGGMTPRIARAVMEEVLGKDLPPFPADFDADKPFSLIMAEAIASQNAANAAPTAPPADNSGDPGSSDDPAAGGGDARAGRDGDGDGNVNERGKKKPKKQPTTKDALRIMKALGILGPDEDDEDDEEEENAEGIETMAKKLLTLNRAAEVLWRRQGGKSGS